MAIRALRAAVAAAQMLRSRPAGRRSRRASTGKIARREPVTSKTRVIPVVVTSSSPSEPWTTKARSGPRPASALAINSAACAEGAPISCRVAPAGLVSGPSRLNTVRIFSSIASRLRMLHGGVKQRARKEIQCRFRGWLAPLAPAAATLERLIVPEYRRCRIAWKTSGCRVWPRARPLPPLRTPRRWRC